MSVGMVNLSFTAGDDVDVPIDFDVDLTGYTFAAQIRATANAVEKVDCTIIPVDLAQGQIRVTIAKDLSAMVGSSAVWDLEWVTPGGKRRTVLAGDVHVRPRVTRV